MSVLQSHANLTLWGEQRASDDYLLACRAAEDYLPACCAAEDYLLAACRSSS